MLIIGELINSTRKPVEEALIAQDGRFFRRLARLQAEAGAGVIDLNAATSLIRKREVEDIEWLVDVVQDELAGDFPEVRLCIDTPNPEAMEAGLRRCRQRPFLNSVTNEKNRERMFDLVPEYNADVIALTMGKRGMPNTVEDRLAEAEALVEKLDARGVPYAHIYFDPIVMPVANRQDQVPVVSESIRRLKATYPGANTTCGLSNISFGLPNRFSINRTYLTLLLEAGLDSAICDPTDRGLQDTIAACNALLGNDEGCMEYVIYKKRQMKERATAAKRAESQSLAGNPPER